MARPGDHARGTAAGVELPEAFQPIAVRSPADSPIRFALRCLLDLQLLTIYRFLRTELPACRGRVLDVGAGESPWRSLLKQAQYVGIDVEGAGEFGMQRKQDIIYYDGKTIPFADGSFDHVLCVEVLEHVPDPAAFLAEIARALRHDGTLVLTVPWSARLHHLPHDYGRFTRYGLASLLGRAGFAPVRIDERGNDVAAVANKLVVMAVRLLRPQRASSVVWTWPLAAIVAPVAAAFVIAAQLSLLWRLGAREDPLGYGVVAVKRRPATPPATAAAST
jgi:SAM-dependent methyltransferase